MMFIGVCWNSSVPISSAVSMPSRVIISSVNRNTPMKADVPVFSADAREVPFDVALDAPRGAPHVDGQRRHRTAATSASTPSQSAWFEARWNRYAAPMLMQHRERDAPVHGGHQLAPPALAQIREADGDDEKGFEPFAKGDDERLQHG